MKKFGFLGFSSEDIDTTPYKDKRKNVFFFLKKNRNQNYEIVWGTLK